MRALLVFLIAMAAIAYIQSERNHCYWHGKAMWTDWVYCLIKP
jgi:hypothetical protein